MATLSELCENGALVRFEPILDEDEQPMRAVYMPPIAHEWSLTSNEIEGARLTPNPHSYDRVCSTLSDFCSGRMLLEGAEVRNLVPPSKSIWELKTRPQEKYTVRIFGWFYRVGIFISPLCKYKNTVSSRCRVEIGVVEQFRQSLGLDAPKIAQERTYAMLMRV